MLGSSSVSELPWWGGGLDRVIPVYLGAPDVGEDDALMMRRARH
jgi:hypothetical protein